jgi:hypothetical protein
MKFTRAVALALLCSLVPTRLPADVITDWNDVMLEAIRINSVPPTRSTRVMAMAHAATFDAVNSIDDTHQPYHVNLVVAPGASREAAAAQSAHDVLVNQFPAQQATFGAALTNNLSSIPDGPAKVNGRAAGQQVAAQIIALRANDHSGDTTPYTPGTLPGQWRPTPPGLAQPLGPNWPTVTPWTMTSGSQFRHPTGPPALASAEYAAALNEVKAIGAVNSATRTAEQTDIARFWGSGILQGPGHWNQIAQSVGEAQGNTLSENARMFALLNLAQADAVISTWDNKYQSNFWRPVTAIQLADQDGNAATDADPNWLPLLTTPAHPSYSSGHSTVSMSAAETLKQFFGTDDISFTTNIEGFTFAPRSFISFSQAAQEAATSRLYGGIHYRFDNEHGLQTGILLGQHVYANELQPIPEPATWVLLVLGVHGCLVWRRTARDFSRR